jgi:hypothetical protein
MSEAIQVETAPVVYELQQRVRDTAPAHIREMAKGLPEWHHTKNWREGQENDAYFWKERWEGLWGELFEFRFNPVKAQPVRPETLHEAPFNMEEAMQEALEENLTAARRVEA